MSKPKEKSRRLNIEIDEYLTEEINHSYLEDNKLHGKAVVVYSEKPLYIALSAIQGRGWTNIGPDTDKEIQGIYSQGISNGVIIIVKSQDNKYISLQHAASISDIKKEIDTKITRIETLSKTDVTIEFGISNNGLIREMELDGIKLESIRLESERWQGENTRIQTEQEKKEFLEKNMKEAKEKAEKETKKKFNELQKLGGEYKKKVLFHNLPKSAIFIGKDGKINFFGNENVEPEMSVPDEFCLLLTPTSPSPLTASPQGSPLIPILELEPSLIK